MNAYGQFIKMVQPNAVHEAGKHQIEFANDNYPSGIYFFVLEMDEERLLKKVLIQ